MEPKIRLVVAESKALVQKFFTNTLQKFPEFWIAGVAATTFDLNRLISNNSIDIILMDKDQVCKFYPKLIQDDEKVSTSMHKFVLVGEEPDHEAMDFILYMDARGYIPKTADDNLFRNTIVKAFNGGEGFSSEYWQKLRQVALNRNARNYDRILSKREVQIFELLKRGLSNKKIAEFLSISLDTVKTHRKNIFSKLKCHSITDLINHKLQ